MTNRLSRVKKDNPELAERSEVQEMAADIDRYASVAALASTPGGKVLFDALLQDAASLISELTTKYREADHSVLIVLCSRLDARIALLQTLNRSRTNLELAEEALREITT
jgi:hypothetical protein